MLLDIPQRSAILPLVSTTETNATEAVTCPRCNGTGDLPSMRHVDDGLCYQCDGTGRCELKPAPVAKPHRMVDAETARRRLRVLYRNARDFGLTFEEATEGGSAPALLFELVPDAVPHFRALGWEV